MFDQISIYDLLPQKPPFVLIDKLLHYDPVETRTSFTPQRDSLFIDDNGCFSQSGILENIAQTCAARMGYINLMSGESVKLGFIGAVKDYVVHRTPAIGERIVTTITVLNEVLSLTLVSAVVCSQEEVLAECQMKIAISEIDKQ